MPKIKTNRAAAKRFKKTGTGKLKRNKAYNPIEHIKTRVKLPKSILRKVYLKGLPLDAEVIKEELNDLAGLRIICTFKSDIYRLVEILKKYENIKVLEIMF